MTDIRFTLDEVLDFPSVLEADEFNHVDSDTVFAVLDEVGRMFAEQIAPLNKTADSVGATWNPDGSVTTAPGFKEAYKQFVESGFGAIPFPFEFGGGAFPWAAALAVQEMMNSASMGFALCPLLTQGAIEAFLHHASPEIQAAYLPKMITGEWTGSMNLTEPHAGSDVGAVTTKAAPVGDGSWRLSGQKIFITYGEHDMTDNIVHLVLARTPGAAPGTRGISMFVVPKFLINEDGSLGERNDVSCVSIEHKLGIHGSPTCVLAFGENEGAIGWLVGDEGAGMRNMFTMMNNARLGVGLQGLSVAERAYQQALAYAQERLQGTAVGAAKGTSSPIIDHPDVRRMLMTQRAWLDALRYLIYSNAVELDLAKGATNAEDRLAHQEIADLLIPLSKSLGTDVGCEMTSIAIQVHGGMGYIEETGAAQHFRDIRIAPIYEGTNGIQAADLVGRKLQMRGGAVVVEQLDRCTKTASEMRSVAGLKRFADNLDAAVEAAREATSWLLENSSSPRDLLAGSSPYLRLLGTVLAGGLCGRAAVLASAHDTDPDGFYAAKVTSAKFFGEQILPTATGLVGAVCAGAEDLFALSAAQLS